MDNSSQRGNNRPLEEIVSEARQHLDAAETRLTALHAEALKIANTTQQEHTELLRFIEEFALVPALANPLLGDRPSASGQLDLERVRARAAELANEAGRSAALQASLATSVQSLQSAADQLEPENVFTAIQETSDVRLQHAMNTAREEERRRLAREIHDGPAQVLTNAIYAIQVVEEIAKRQPDQVPEELKRVRALLKDGVSEIRRFMFDLRPTMLQDYGLATTLRRYVDDYCRLFSRSARLQMVTPLPPLTSVQELTIFRIVQEALQNVHKHGGPKAEIDISLSVNGDTLTMEIKDTGRGFDPNSVVSREDSGAGIAGMRERAKVAGGQLEITSTLGGGTLVRLKLRLRNDQTATPGAGVAS